MPSSPPTKILIVDDDPGIRSLCSRFLGASDHEITEAEAGEEAAACLSQNFDIVLTDLKMPGPVNGNELAHRVRSSSNADVIIMTGSPELETALQAMREGASDYLIKPFSLENLRHTVERCLERRRLSNELQREKSLRADAAMKALHRHGPSTEMRHHHRRDELVVRRELSFRDVVIRKHDLLRMCDRDGAHAPPPT